MNSPIQFKAVDVIWSKTKSHHCDLHRTVMDSAWCGPVGHFRAGQK